MKPAKINTASRALAVLCFVFIACWVAFAWLMAGRTFAPWFLGAATIGVLSWLIPLEGEDGRQEKPDKD